MILTVDLGTSVTKVALWDPAAAEGEGGLVALAESTIPTDHPAPGRSEQDPSDWWSSLIESCAELRAAHARALRSVEVIGCTGARQTLVAADEAGEALGPAIVWSDRRAADQAGRLAPALGAGDGPPAESGIVVDAGSVAAKIAWLADHDAARLAAARWLLSPRDLIAWWLTGEVVTDQTMASRSGLYAAGGEVVAELVGEAGPKLPPVVEPGHRLGGLVPAAATALGLAAGTPVVIGAADRPSEVLGTGASEGVPMVSWGTTANVSVPVGARPVPPTPGVVVSMAADGGWLLEGGMSAAGSFLDWLGRLTGHPSSELATLAGSCPPGARGVVATCWLDGARAPWWRPDAGAALVGLGSAHGAAELARAGFEAVAWEVRRCLGAIAARRPPGPPVTGLALAGGGAAIPVWGDVLTGITGLGGSRRRSGQAASAGAALIAGRAVGLACDLEQLDPVADLVEPEPAAIDLYAALADGAEMVAVAVIELTGAAPASGEPGCA